MPKTIVITGANAGIGLASAHRLAADGHTIVMACRNQEKANAAREQILEATPGARVDVLSLDLSSFGHIRRFASELAAQHPQVDVLINNAGASPMRQSKTEDGYELQWGANYLGPFLLTHLLLPQLQAAPTGDARIIHLASVAHSVGRINENTWRGRRFYFTFSAYAQSKMGNLLFSNALARRLPAGVTSNALHPGNVRSDIWREIPQPVRSVVMLALITPERPSQLITDMAVSEEHRGRNGEYLAAQTPSPVRRYTKNQAAQDDLYAKSCELVGVEPLPVRG
ncbi:MULTISPECIES: SDR family NAD(P)-dependent oxidoreductase [Mycobacteroides]|jgi:NAD(P)-dependent dehydrogenase (short-subunit alcohol dehydrogenase family)|uniref:Oxidoreductase n=1 Tax=Mycobacteroides chelonae TaxID=1774 RepID=A0A1S1LQ48_MYCCH|nr:MULTISPECIES: SDR family NAD(P)-dependent oxidoreductase [Mycobacteroides]KRQ24618.1 oxidoreductase [Mycobacteroides sp. H003]KRQ37472.1 oxidoreductase [Mycobacteroides sp. H092]KRQ45080.1 oxidoreductase [Mycobacteroides sp. H101]KRQ47927.1 oxidoreductase [Mycobacteroides sp. H063]KRQ58605.1 oxidoreductase [Mycobacteroides sp. H070]